MTIRGVIPPEYQNVTDTNVGKMTEQEAIHEIETMEQMECACPDCERRRPALHMAIEALRFQESVVRCGDCGQAQHLANGEMLFCEYTMRTTSRDGFCDYGWRNKE